MNIAEILKDCPKGTKLYSPVYGDCALYDVNDYGIRIETLNKYALICLYHDGKYCFDGECLLFPSKENRDWSTFQRPFKDGDIIYTELLGHKWISIFKKFDEKDCMCYVDYCKNPYSHSENKTYPLCEIKEVTCQRLATEEEKQMLFDTIKANGHKWNAETKTLEKIFELKFKVGDIVQNKNTNMIGTITLIDNVERDYKVALENGSIIYILFKFQDSWELVPKFKVGDKIVHKENRNNPFVITDIINNRYKGGTQYEILIEQQDNFELIPNKFDISTLKPFDKVLVRLTNNCIWMPKFFSYYDINSKLKYYPFVITDNIGYPQCIPFEGNEHLLGTTDDCDKFYKNW